MAENMTTLQANRSNDLVPDKRQQTGNKVSGAPGDITPRKVPPFRDWVGFAVLVLINILLARWLFPGQETTVTIPYTAFKEEIAKSNVQVIYCQGEVITGSFIKAIAYPPPSRTGIIVLAATNQPDVLDKALLRPGRFDRQVVVNLPDKTGRLAILKVHTRSVPLSEDTHLEEIAATTPGFSGADLRNLVNEAALMAARCMENQVHHKDFLDALEKIVLGPERPLFLSQSDKERIAYHESGHTILGLLVPGSDPVKRVTIVPRGQALGVTYSRPDTDRYNYPEAYIRAKITGMLGGRVAEEVVYGTKTTGVENDIEQATNLARLMVTRWGMSEVLGMVQLAPRENPYLGKPGGFGGENPFSEETAKAIDAEVLKIINDSHRQAVQLITDHRMQLDALAGSLMTNETLDEQEILKVTGLPAASVLDSGKLTRAVA